MKNAIVSIGFALSISSNAFAYNVIELDPNEYWVMSSSGTSAAALTSASNSIEVVELQTGYRIERPLPIDGLGTLLNSISDDGRYAGLTDYHFGSNRYSAATFDTDSEDPTVRYLAEVLGLDTYTRLIASSADGKTHLALQDQGFAPTGSPRIQIWQQDQGVRSFEPQLDVSYFNARTISSSGTKVIGELGDSHGMHGVYIWENGTFNYVIEGGRPLDFHGSSADGSIILGTRYNPTERRYLPYRYTQESGLQDLDVFGTDPYSGTFYIRGSDDRGLRILAQDYNYGSEEKCLISEKGQAAYNLKTKLLETEGLEYLNFYRMDCLKISSDGKRILANLQPQFQDGETWLRTIVIELPSVCIADFNDDGGVDGSDMGDFFSAYKVRASSADLDHSGTWDSLDIKLFFESFEKGC